MGIKLAVIITLAMAFASAVYAGDCVEPRSSAALDLEKVRLKFEKEALKRKLQSAREHIVILKSSSRPVPVPAQKELGQIKSGEPANRAVSKESTEDLERLLKKVAAAEKNSGVMKKETGKTSAGQLTTPQ